jgi:hypothetical protein
MREGGATRAAEGGRPGSAFGRGAGGTGCAVGRGGGAASAGAKRSSGAIACDRSVNAGNVRAPLASRLTGGGRRPPRQRSGPGRLAGSSRRCARPRTAYFVTPSRTAISVAELPSSAYSSRSRSSKATVQFMRSSLGRARAIPACGHGRASRSRAGRPRPAGRRPCLPGRRRRRRLGSVSRRAKAAAGRRGRARRHQFLHLHEAIRRRSGWDVALRVVQRICS